MSGGSYNYAYTKVEDFAANLRNTHTDPRRAAFKELCERVAKAMYEIEWVDSCDTAPGDEDAAIDAALGCNAMPIILEKSIQMAVAERDRLDAAIRAEKEKTSA